MIEIRLTENVWQLGNRHFNVFVVGQTEGAIVECAVTGAVHSLSQQWSQWPGLPPIRYLLVSHAHFDHVCGIPALRAMFPQAVVCASAEAKRVLGKAKIVDDFLAQDEKMSGVLAAEGIVPEGLVIPKVQTITVDQIINEGEQICLKDSVSMQVINAPGHSPCNVAYYLPQDKVMFLSDAGGFQISDASIFPIFFQDYNLYIETLKKLRCYPTRVLALPHEGIWLNDDVQTFYDGAIKAAQSAYINIEMMLNNGWNEQNIIESLFAQYYRENLQIYTTANITTCVELLLRRVKDCL